ncbi:Membrane-associated phospholipid phosphatase [Thiothrix eikelboomii]|uniref:undecaprenyl-diphosphate phosphatase n=1 Tax=Thiothrix eikelboomii TaxID=92487 RepID=A0A1T4VXD5_9GAMM|nr:phosphatase PAP2 family protein [Thiothrix eikelboomii]SKA69468.1 Membrane-associated phospholipid phosphatase [Thiothrix eikelboomii]
MKSRSTHTFLIICLVLALSGVFWFIIRMSLSGYTAFDTGLSEFIRSLRNPVTDRSMLAATLLGNWLVVTLTVTTLCLVLMYQRRWVLVAAILTMMAGAGVFVSGIKLLVAAVRPEADLYQKGASVFSFPSGHTTFSSLLGVLLIWFAVRGLNQPWLRLVSVLVLIFMIVMVALSRIYLGAHWPTDIVTGFLFSMSLALIFALIFENYPSEPAADLSVLQASVLTYLLMGVVYLTYKWPSAIVMYTPST